MRKGREVELKSFAGNVSADGGYAVPKEIDAVIDAALKSISPIRAVANVVQVGSAGYRKLVTTNGVASGWASEVAARPATATPTRRWCCAGAGRTAGSQRSWPPIHQPRCRR